MTRFEKESTTLVLEALCNLSLLVARLFVVTMLVS